MGFRTDALEGIQTCMLHVVSWNWIPCFYRSGSDRLAVIEFVYLIALLVCQDVFILHFSPPSSDPPCLHMWLSWLFYLPFLKKKRKRKSVVN